MKGETPDSPRLGMWNLSFLKTFVLFQSLRGHVPSRDCFGVEVEFEHQHWFSAGLKVHRPVTVRQRPQRRSALFPLTPQPVSTWASAEKEENTL